jgi:integrase
MKAYPFTSCLADKMVRFIDLKCCSGIDRSYAEKQLGHFDRFLSRSQFDSPRMNPQTIALYLQEQAQVGPRTRYHRFCAAKQFCIFLWESDPHSYVPDTIPSGHDTAGHRAHIYSTEEISSVLRIASLLSPEKPLRAQTYATVIGLLYATGMRISEAIGLNIEHFHEDTGLLFIREGKFGKSRWIPLLPSARQAVEHYIDLRSMSPPAEPESPLFINLCGRRLNRDTVSGMFRAMLRQAGFRTGKGPGPRLHDLRHSFAVRCLLKWYQAGEDVNARLPWLATYMGHVHVAHTMVYLHATTELLTEVGRRFETHYQTTIKPFNEKESSNETPAHAPSHRELSEDVPDALPAPRKGGIPQHRVVLAGHDKAAAVFCRRQAAQIRRLPDG